MLRIRSIKTEFSAKRAQESIRSFLFVDGCEGLDLRPRNIVQLLFIDAHAVGKPREAVPVELSEGDEIYQGA